MIDKKEIEAFVEEGLTGSDCFVVDVQVKPDNVIVVEIDNEEGVDIDRCVALHRFLNRSSTEMSKIMNWRLGRQGLPLRSKSSGSTRKI